MWPGSGRVRRRGRARRGYKRPRAPLRVWRARIRVLQNPQGMAICWLAKLFAGSRSVGVVVGSSSTHVRTAHARSEARRRVGPYRSWARAPNQQQSYRPRHALLLATHAWDEACRRAVRAHRRAARAYRPARKCISAASSAREQQQHGGGEAGRPRNLETRALVTWCAHTLVGCRTADGDRRQRLYIRESSAD